jgi:hypothetical protein
MIAQRGANAMAGQLPEARRLLPDRPALAPGAVAAI